MQEFSNINENEAHIYDSISSIVDYRHAYAYTNNLSNQPNRKPIWSLLHNRKYLYLIISFILFVCLAVIILVTILIVNFTGKDILKCKSLEIYHATKYLFFNATFL